MQEHFDRIFTMVGGAHLDRIFTWKNEEIKKAVSTAFLPRKSGASTSPVAHLDRVLPRKMRTPRKNAVEVAGQFLA